MPNKVLHYEFDPATGKLRLRGDWTMDHAAGLTEEIKAFSSLSVQNIDAREIEKIDLWGALQLRDLSTSSPHKVELSESHKSILDLIPPVSHEKGAPLPALHGLADPMVAMGKMTANFLSTAFALISFIGEISVCFIKNIFHPKSFRFHSIVRHIDETGLRALPIIGLLAVLISMVISYQAATQLSKFGASIFTVDLTVISLLREMAVLVTAIMVAGRSGSAFAAEIGVMKLREEIDALRTMGFDPMEMLVLPRLIAMMITLPVLTFFADIIGLLGGAVISVLMLDIPLDQYIDRVQSVATPTMFFVGLIKAPVFAFLITVIGTYQGMNVSGSAESVGRLTTVSVVQSIFLVILVDALFSILFANLGI